VLLAVHEFFAMFVYAITGPLGLALYLTLKMGSGQVTKVRHNIVRIDPQAPEWETEVVAEVLELVTRVLPTLSDGWSEAAVAVTAIGWAFALAYVCWALSSPSTMSMIIYFVEALIGAAFLYDLADTSTECDLLVKALNDKRVSHPADEHHIKIQKIEVMLNQLNKGHG
jgi:hypothetical protein